MRASVHVHTHTFTHTYVRTHAHARPHIDVSVDGATMGDNAVGIPVGDDIDGAATNGVTDLPEGVSKCWRLGASMSVPRDAETAAVGVIGSRFLVVAGGCAMVPETEGSSRLKLDAIAVTEVYDAFTDTWRTVTPMPEPRAMVQANVIDDLLVVEPENACETRPAKTTAYLAYDIKTDSWCRVTGRVLAGGIVTIVKETAIQDPCSGVKETAFQDPCSGAMPLQLCLASLVPGASSLRRGMKRDDEGHSPITDVNVDRVPQLVRM